MSGSALKESLSGDSDGDAEACLAYLERSSGLVMTAESFTLEENSNFQCHWDFLDFYTQFIADEFRKMGTESRIHSFNFPALEYLRKNPTEMRSVNIARMFEKQENLDELATLLKRESR